MNDCQPEEGKLMQLQDGILFSYISVVPQSVALICSGLSTDVTTQNTSGGPLIKAVVVARTRGRLAACNRIWKRCIDDVVVDRFNVVVTVDNAVTLLVAVFPSSLSC